MIEYVWEKMGMTLDIKKNHNYIIYFNGCFCPPHRGHYNSINDIVKNNKNIKVIINIKQKNNDTRHGIPKYINIAIWKEYIKHMFPKNSVSLQRGNFMTDKNFINHDFIKQADTVIFVRGDEGLDHRTIKNSFETKKKSILKLLSKENKKIMFYYNSRVKNLSATDFVKHLINFKIYHQGKTKCKPCYSILYSFLPSNLPNHVCKKIIKKLLRCDLKI